MIQLDYDINVIHPDGNTIPINPLIDKITYTEAIINVYPRLFISVYGHFYIELKKLTGEELYQINYIKLVNTDTGETVWEIKNKLFIVDDMIWLPQQKLGGASARLTLKLIPIEEYKLLSYNKKLSFNKNKLKVVSNFVENILKEVGHDELLIEKTYPISQEYMRNLFVSQNMNALILIKRLAIKSINTFKLGGYLFYVTGQKVVFATPEYIISEFLSSKANQYDYTIHIGEYESDKLAVYDMEYTLHNKHLIKVFGHDTYLYSFDLFKNNLVKLNYDREGSILFKDGDEVIIKKERYKRFLGNYLPLKTENEKVFRSINIWEPSIYNLKALGDNIENIKNQYILLKLRIDIGKYFLPLEVGDMFELKIKEVDNPSADLSIYSGWYFIYGFTLNIAPTRNKYLLTVDLLKHAFYSSANYPLIRLNAIVE